MIMYELTLFEFVIWISKLQQNLINHTIWSACLHFRQRNMLEYFDEKKFFIVFIAS